MNPFDEIAVEEAVRLREKHKEAITKIVSQYMPFYAYTAVILLDITDCRFCWTRKVRRCASNCTSDGS
jgi:hypothetical protein